MKQSKKSTIASVSTLSLLLGAAPFAAPSAAEASTPLHYQALGSAAGVRSLLLRGGNTSNIPLTFSGDKEGEEGKCGEGKCGEGKCGDKDKDKEGDEAKCGEGKCG